MNPPRRVLDLYCCAGGATMGMIQAWPEAHVTGVDIKWQKNYCGHDFIQGDAIAVARRIGRKFDFIWASPPCQSYSAAMRHLAAPQPMLIEPLRELLLKLGVPWVIENVVGAPLRNPLVLCGTMFGMRVHRHRLFESPFLPASRPRCKVDKPVLNPHREESRQRIYAEFGRQDPEKLWGREMGLTWMTRHETREAIPPAYSRYIAEQYLLHSGENSSTLIAMQQSTK